MNTSEDNLEYRNNEMSLYMDTSESAQEDFANAGLKVTNDYEENEFYENMLNTFNETLATPLL